MEIKLQHTDYTVKQEEFIERYLKTLCYSDGKTISLMKYNELFSFLKEMNLYAFYDYNEDCLFISSDWCLLT